MLWKIYVYSIIFRGVNICLDCPIESRASVRGLKLNLYVKAFNSQILNKTPPDHPRPSQAPQDPARHSQATQDPPKKFPWSVVPDPITRVWVNRDVQVFHPVQVRHRAPAVWSGVGVDDQQWPRQRARGALVNGFCALVPRQPANVAEAVVQLDRTPIRRHSMNFPRPRLFRRRRILVLAQRPHEPVDHDPLVLRSALWVAGLRGLFRLGLVIVARCRRHGPNIV